MKRGAYIALLWLCGLFVFACTCSKAPLATLHEANGKVERDFSASVAAWQEATVGATFEFGDALKTGGGSNALAIFDDEARLRLEPSTTVRFVRELSNGATAGVSVEGGSVVLQTVGSPINLQTDLGPAVVLPGTTVHLARRDAGVRLFVEVGAAQLDPGGPNERNVAAGQTVEIAIGAAVMDVPSNEAPKVAPPASAIPDGPVTANDQVGHTIVTLEQGSVSLVRNGRLTPLAQGAHEVEPGTSLRLKAGSRVAVVRGDSRATLTGPGTFVVGEGTELLRIDEGSVVLRGAQRLPIPGGWIEVRDVDGPGLVEVTRRGNSTEVSVRAGRAILSQGDGQVTVEAGQAATADGKAIRVRGIGAAYRDVGATVGGSLVIHNAEPPTAVGFAFADKCEHLGTLEVVDGTKVLYWASGAKGVNLALPTGAHNYRLRCLSRDGVLGQPVATGRISIYGDSGSMLLPKSAPSNVVSTDGRSYTLLYQTRLPTVTVQWPNAPAAESYSLVVSSDGKTRSLHTPRPSYSFPSGGLGEGKHTFQFHSGSGRSSRPSMASIQFDNAAPKASISSPVDGSFAPGSSVEVSGIALPGWDVFAQGIPLATDSQGRFASSVTASDRGVVFTFSSPKRGVHYYLRRARGVNR